ncbi:MAG TPA: alpha/beta fold hydrolase [Glycomyces sp.]|nr:alpha/beta fold hydrolase [Glycomyces sp.]
MTAKGIRHDPTDSWLAPLRTDRAVRADLVKYLKTTRRTEMLEAAEELTAYPDEALIVWGRQDRMMPPAHARRLDDLIPNADLLDLNECGTLIPIDRPKALAEAIRTFAQ